MASGGGVDTWSAGDDRRRTGTTGTPEWGRCDADQFTPCGPKWGRCDVDHVVPSGAGVTQTTWSPDVRTSEFREGPPGPVGSRDRYLTTHNVCGQGDTRPIYGGTEDVGSTRLEGKKDLLRVRSGPEGRGRRVGDDTGTRHTRRYQERRSRGRHPSSLPSDTVGVSLSRQDRFDLQARDILFPNVDPPLAEGPPTGVGRVHTDGLWSTRRVLGPSQSRVSCGTPGRWVRDGGP